MGGRTVLPVGLAELPPGPDLAVALAGVDIHQLNGHELVVLLRAQARQVAYDQARLLAVVAEIGHCPPGDADSPAERVDGYVEFAADEIRFALGWTRGAAEGMLGDAYHIVERLPAVHEALASGAIDLPRARVLCDGVSPLAIEPAREVVDAILPEAPGLTTGQLRSRLMKAVITVDPQAATARYRAAVAERRVYRELAPDGSASLAGVGLPADQAAYAYARLDAMAAAAKAKGDERTLDQLRADTFLALLDGRYDGPEPSRRSRRASVELTVGLTTLLGLAEQPAELVGWGPVVAEVARSVAGEGGSRWRHTVVDTATGEITAHGPVRRRPSAMDASYVRARDRTCAAPGCRAPAGRIDLDHTHDFQDGGASTPDNLAALCRHDHRLKHIGGWRYRRGPDGGYVWHSPLHHQYVARPDPPPG